MASDIVTHLVGATFKRYMDLSCYNKIAKTLISVKDKNGRNAFSIASTSVKRVMLEHLLFLGKYEIFAEPIHKSDSSYVYFAWEHRVDCSDGNFSEQNFSHDIGVFGLSAQHENRKVALKFIRNKGNFLQEVQARKDGDGLLDSHCVLPILDQHDGDEDAHFMKAVEVRRDIDDEYRYMIVLPACDKSLDYVLRHGGICGRDWLAIRTIMDEICKCLAEVHKGNRIHGDIK